MTRAKIPAMFKPNPRLTEYEIRRNFVVSPNGEPCHLCESAHGLRIEFMSRCAHPSCVQRVVASKHKIGASVLY